MSTCRDENVRTVRDFFAAASAKDVGALQALLAHDASWTVMGGGPDGGHRFEGPDVIATHMIEAVQDVFVAGEPKSTVVTIVAEDDLVMAETRGVGRRVDGRPYENGYAWAFVMRTGQILHIREYLDTLYASRFFGRIPDDSGA